MFTAANMLSGILAIIFAFMGRLDLAPLAICGGALFDFFDGFLARKLKVDGDMGKQLDSLADMITFGIAPGVIMLVLMTVDIHGFVENRHFEVIRYDFFGYLDDLMYGNANWSVPFIALFIPFFSMLRLAKFNIDTRQSDRFIGLPTPANTLFFMTFPLVLVYSDTSVETLEMVLDPLVLSALILGMSVMMVLEIPLFALKFKTFKWRSNELRYSFLLISIILILVFRTWSIALIVFLYLTLSIFENLIKKEEG